MLLRLGEYIVSVFVTLSYSDCVMLYPAEGTNQVKTLFIKRFNYSVNDLTIQSMYYCSERSIFHPINLNLYKALMPVKLCQYKITL